MKVSVLITIWMRWLRTDPTKEKKIPPPSRVRRENNVWKFPK